MIESFESHVCKPRKNQQSFDSSVKKAKLHLLLLYFIARKLKGVINKMIAAISNVDLLLMISQLAKVGASI